MAVYTHLGAEQLEGLIAAYDVGALVSAKGIAEGVSNSNWLIETTGTRDERQRFILTLYEKRIDTNELPFFLGLLDHLAQRGCAVPATVHDRDGAAWREIAGKSAALIEFLPGVSPGKPTPAQARAVGAALAQIHLAARDFPLARCDDLDLAACTAMLASCGKERLAEIDPALAQTIEVAHAAAKHQPEGLPESIIHSDLFPDNVLMLGDRVTGLIDFYFACNGAMAYDLAVTHAAWCFDRNGAVLHGRLSNALLAGYESVRALQDDERAALPALAERACLRFLASRAEDWLETPSDVQVMRKDPMDFWRRLTVYREIGIDAFAKA
ncbi:homoserine kinase [Porphyrobacter algicida]|uniref:Homoserine kinase n=1 Tax=Qipengyuania algicida TaxID=1836209 RepID=A0A845ADI9_9SPHN|nr:homoserine kinase [Qipengyuania algicida]MXP27547.1 homoserine kinase [Qipengyuania algicida]